jgi:hypothetical protein
MLRYIHIGDQIRQSADIDDPADEFCFYDTVREGFVVLDGESVFSTVEDLRTAGRDHPHTLLRLEGLIPPGRHGKSG